MKWVRTRGRTSEIRNLTVNFKVGTGTQALLLEDEDCARHVHRHDDDDDDDLTQSHIHFDFFSSSPVYNI